MGQDSGTSPSFHVPRLLAFYQDLWDDEGTALGWKPIAWGLRFADGSAISVNIEGRPAVTLWQSLEDATEALDAYVDTPEPRTHLDRPLPPPPPPRADLGTLGDNSDEPGTPSSSAPSSTASPSENPD
jgi:hypothetical protein